MTDDHGRISVGRLSRVGLAVGRRRSAKGDEMEVTRVTVDEVKTRMDRGEQFVFVDTRNPKAWGEADTKLTGAIRVPADEIDQYLDKIPHDRTVITYCT